jgi:hypothetical protein
MTNHSFYSFSLFFSSFTWFELSICQLLVLSVIIIFLFHLAHSKDWLPISMLGLKITVCNCSLLYVFSLSHILMCAQRRLHFVTLCIFLVIWSDEKYSEILQFTIPGGRHAVHHAGLLQEAGAGRVLRAAAAATTASIEAKIFARIVLRNLEHHQSGTSTWTPSRGASSNKQRPLHRWAAWPMQNEPVWLSEPFYITTVLACADSDWRNSTEGITHNCEVTEWNISGGPSRVGRLRLSAIF